MATTPKLVGPADPALIKSFENQTPSVARTSPPTLSANGTATSTGGTVTRGIAPRTSGDTTTYNQATQASSGTELFIVSSNSNDSNDIVTVYNTEKQISVSAVNQTVNNYKVTNNNAYGNSNVAAFLPTYDGNLSSGNLVVSGVSDLGSVANVRIEGGTGGQVLSTNGSGALVWSNVSSGPSLGNITINGDNVSSTNDIVNIVGDNYAQLQSSNTYMWVEDGEADIEVNGNRWIFNDSGYMQIPNDGLFGAVNSSILALSSQNNKPIFIEVVDTGSSEARQWIFDNAGNLTLPGNTFAVNYANGTQVSIGGGGGGAAGNAGDIQINVAGNIGADSTLRYVDNGGEMTLYADYLNAPGIFTSDIYAGDGTPSNITLTTSYGNATWTFDTAGNLRTPGNVDIYGAINFPQQVSSLNWSTYNIELSQYGRINTNVDFFANANTIGAQYLKGDGSNITNVNAIQVVNGTSNVTVPTTNGNVVITANGTANWTFGTTGNLNTAGDIVGPAGANLTIYANAGVHEFIFADDGTFYAPDNVVLGGNAIYIGPGANTLAGTEHAVLIASSNNFAYIQGVINNVSDNGSADWVAQGHLGNDTGGWADMGFTSDGFGDANYTITGQGDGYVFAQSYASGQAPGGRGGNLVLATGENGITNDIIFGTGGFLTANIFGRISNANNSFELSRTGATITFPDSSVQTTAPVAETSFTVIATNFEAEVGMRYGVNTTGSAITATLPASPATGVAIFFADAGGAYSTNNLIIDPNGETIMGASGNMTVSTNNQSVGLFYNGTTWRIYNAG